MLHQPTNLHRDLQHARKMIGCERLRWLRCLFPREMTTMPRTRCCSEGRSFEGTSKKRNADMFDLSSGPKRELLASEHEVRPRLCRPGELDL